MCCVIYLQGTQSASAPGTVPAIGASGPDPSDLMHVMQEAEELGFEASVFSNPLTPATTQQQESLPADAMPQTNDLTYTLTPAAHDISRDSTSALLRPKEEDHVHMNDSVAVGEAHGKGSHVNVSVSLGRVHNKPSNSRLHTPGQEHLANFDIDAVDPHAVTSKGTEAMVAPIEDAQTDPTV